MKNLQFQVIQHKTPIPLSIITNAATVDFCATEKSKSFCCYCGEENGNHYYACPDAVEFRLRKISELQKQKFLPTIILARAK